MTEPTNEGWKSNIKKKYFVTNLLTGSPAGAEQDLIADITQLLTEERAKAEERGRKDELERTYRLLLASDMTFSQKMALIEAHLDTILSKITHKSE